MRRIKRVEDTFTLESKARLEETDQLCDQCGNSECSVRAIMKRLAVNRYNARVSVLSCKSYIPTFDFRDDAGLEGMFNTFRLGGAWAERVAPGTLVNLRRTDGTHIGEAEVIATHVGLFEEMNAKFGFDNHLAIDAEVRGEEFDLEKVMRECYGGHRFSAGSLVSVIELKRINGVTEKG